LFAETPLKVEENRWLFFQDITKLIESFNHKLQIENYLQEEDKRKKEKKAVELTYAYIIQFILYKTLVDNNFDDFAEEFSASVTAIHTKLKQERYEKILGIIDNISNTISKNIYRPFDTEQQFIRKRLLELYHSIENSLSDVSPWLDIFVFIKKYNFANVRNDIFGFIYENYLKELYEEQNKGQYFTDPEVVNFMLEQVGYTQKEIKRRYESDKNSVSIIDPACGSGTFLYSATDAVVKAFGNGNTLQTSKTIEEIVTNNIFGLDIEEFPLYLAEMSILMRLLPLIINEKYNNPIDQKIKVFKTRDSIAEFWDTAIRNTISDLNIEMQRNGGGLQLGLLENRLGVGYESYVRDEDDLKEMKHSLEANKIPRRRFDFVLANPPYISYNECSKQKTLIFELMKERKAKLSNIYGINLHSTPDRQKKYSPKPNLFAFFIALGLALLKDHGKISFIIPQTILTSGDLDVIRYHLAEFTTIEKIIVFSGNMFVGRGIRQNKPIATSSLIFVANRHVPPSLHKVEVVNCGDKNGNMKTVFENIKSKNKKTFSRKEIYQSTLQTNITNWNFIKFGQLLSGFYQEYIKNSNSIALYYDHSLAESNFKNRFYFDGGGKIDNKYVSELSADNYELFNYKGNDYSKFKITASDNYYPRHKEVAFPQGSQGIDVFNQKFKIIWRTRDPVKFQYTDRNLLLVGNQSLTITSNNKSEILYLFALLNSGVSKLILRNNLTSENERSLFVAITSIKQFIRIPKITEFNQFTKDKIIKLTDQLLKLEEMKLSDLVDFSGILQQKFSEVSVIGNKLKLHNGTELIELFIKGDTKIIAGNLEENPYSLEELKQLPMIDFERQKKIKHHIDDLVFALYFNVPLRQKDIDNPDKIKLFCQSNHFYKVTQKYD